MIIDHGKNIPEHLNFQPGNSKKRPGVYGTNREI